MYDLIYAGDDYERARKDLTETFPDAKIEDASDFIHEGRLSVEVNIETDKYRTKLLDLGMPMISLNFQMFTMMKPVEAKAFVERWITSKEETE